MAMTGPNFNRRVNLAARCMREILLKVLPEAARKSPQGALRVLRLLEEVNRLIVETDSPAECEEHRAALLKPPPV
jgi:hypothetical protein